MIKCNLLWIFVKTELSLDSVSIIQNEPSGVYDSVIDRSPCLDEFKNKHTCPNMFAKDECSLSDASIKAGPSRDNENVIDKALDMFKDQPSCSSESCSNGSTKVEPLWNDEVKPSGLDMCVKDEPCDLGEGLSVTDKLPLDMFVDNQSFYSSEISRSDGPTIVEPLWNDDCKVKSSCSDLCVKEKPCELGECANVIEKPSPDTFVDNQPSCSSERSHSDLSTKVEPLWNDEVEPSGLDSFIKEEPCDLGEGASCVSEDMVAELYAGHTVKDELVVGPVVVEQRKAYTQAQGETLQKNEIRSPKPYRCGNCGYKTAEKSAIFSHLKSHIPKKPLESANDGKKALPQENLKNCTEKKLLKCGYCSYTSNRKTSLRIHERRHTGDKPYKCYQCNYASIRKQSLVKHIRKHSNNVYKCEECDYVTTETNHFLLHEMMHRGDKPYKCNHCNYATCRKWNLTLHGRLHASNKPYKCDQCSYASFYKHNLLTHKEKHSSGIMCRHCSFSSKNKNTLLIHERKHTDKKPYKCDQCSFACGQNNHLQRHKKKHTTMDKRYECDRCDFVTIAKYTLTLHERTHIEKPCDQCNGCALKNDNQ